MNKADPNKNLQLSIKLMLEPKNLMMKSENIYILSNEQLEAMKAAE